MKPTIAIDLAKSVFEVAISNRPGRLAKRLRLSRKRLLPFFAQQPPSTVLLEACSSAHFWLAGSETSVTTRFFSRRDTCALTAEATRPRAEWLW